MLEKKDFTRSQEDFDKLKFAVNGALAILSEAPRVWTGNEEREQQAAQEHVKATTGAVRGDTMLSYNQKSSHDLVTRLDAKLKTADIPTWVDYTDMPSGDLYKGMSEGVEGAGVVLVCLSAEYKTSRSCRLEAEYSARLNKRILFVHCEVGYQPDGWLGLLLGNNLYYNIAKDFDRESDLLLKHLKQILHGSSIIEAQQQATLPSGQQAAGVARLGASPTVSRGSLTPSRRPVSSPPRGSVLFLILDVGNFLYISTYHFMKIYGLVINLTCKSFCLLS